MLLHRTPSVGSVTKKIMTLHPELSAHDMIGIIKESMEAQGEEAGDFATSERVNEAKALGLARATVEERKGFKYPAARA